MKQARPLRKPHRSPTPACPRGQTSAWQARHSLASEQPPSSVREGRNLIGENELGTIGGRPLGARERASLPAPAHL